MFKSIFEFRFLIEGFNKGVSVFKISIDYKVGKVSVKMNKNNSKVTSPEEFMKEASNAFGIEVIEGIERFTQDCCEPYEWVPIDGTHLQIGIIPFAGGVLKCCECQSRWSLDYYWISLPRYEEKGDIYGFNDIVNLWAENRKWWECPCCTYESTDK